MQKVTPDPPNADNVSAQESPRTEKPGDATDRNVDDAHLTFAHLKALPRQPSTFFIVNPELPVQDLLGFASEAAASACVIIADKADQESGSIRNTLFGPGTNHLGDRDFGERCPGPPRPHRVVQPTPQAPFKFRGIPVFRKYECHGP
ncbi:hypothetical protein NTD84_09425, partial [Pseudomonas sp. 14P_8.1_Bac3]|uniref:hypothetical protein n=1 Tax=Pseudomonas sp. 14P_8.1_Bac3 TaxID=2971621 RepID=UPI0021C670C9